MPPSRPARGVGMVGRSKLLQMRFVEGSRGNSYGRLVINSTNRGTTDRTKRSAGVRRRAPSGRFSARPRPLDILGLKLDPGQGESAGMFAAARARAGMWSPGCTGRSEPDGPTQATAFILLGIHFQPQVGDLDLRYLDSLLRVRARCSEHRSRTETSPEGSGLALGA